jgi:hypothetical protein
MPLKTAPLRYSSDIASPVVGFRWGRSTLHRPHMRPLRYLVIIVAAGNDSVRPLLK